MYRSGGDKRGNKTVRDGDLYSVPNLLGKDESFCMYLCMYNIYLSRIGDLHYLVTGLLKKKSVLNS